MGFAHLDSKAFREPGQLPCETVCDVYADRKIRAVDQTRISALTDGPHFIELLVPPSGADDDPRSVGQASSQVVDHSLRSRKVDDRLELGQHRRGESRS